MPVGIVLVHGYSGSPQDLEDLAGELAAHFGADAVNNICLPGHSDGSVPRFDQEAYIDCISKAVQEQVDRRRKIVLLGHSTGGTLTLAFLSKHAFRPNLLILAAAPRKIDIGYLERWNNHRLGKTNIPFSSLAKLITAINAAGALQFEEDFPVLIIHGENDKLVLPAEVSAWQKDSFAGPKRLIWIPSANHQLFVGANRAAAIDVVQRTIKDIADFCHSRDQINIEKLLSMEREAKRFLQISPFSATHLARSPSGRRLILDRPAVTPYADNEPVMANIEITTRCNLNCRHCARSWLHEEDSNMPLERFVRILDMLPHAYRVTLVGLGEPLLHAEVASFVAEASARGRRVALVTNAMYLDERLASQLLKAGLASIAFSIDTDDQDLADEVRSGSNLSRIFKNIRGFLRQSACMGSISTAVFTAVSFKTVAHLKQLVETVASLGVHVLMLTDLNFKQNLQDTLWKSIPADINDSVRDAVRYAFSKKLPVLSVHGLEEFGLRWRYRDYLLLPPSQLFQRSHKANWCRSPWQTIAVDVSGNAAVCDCQPEKRIGHILKQPFSEIWNGEMMIDYRRRMLGPNPPEACMICPRF